MTSSFEGLPQSLQSDPKDCILPQQILGDEYVYEQLCMYLHQDRPVPTDHSRIHASVPRKSMGSGHG